MTLAGTGLRARRRPPALPVSRRHRISEGGSAGAPVPGLRLLGRLGPLPAGPTSVSITAIASSLSHSAGPSSRPTSWPLRSITTVVGRPGAPSSRPARPFGIVIDGEAGDPQLVEEIAHLGDVAAIERQRDHLEAVAAEPGLQAVERGHLVTARRAPRGPEVQHHHLAPKVGEADLVARRRRRRSARAPAWARSVRS